MKVSIHSLHWNNTNELAEMHKEVTKHLDVPVHYHNLNGVPHGLFCDEVMRQVDSDVIGFMDIDCVPTNKEIVERCIRWAIDNNSFIGLAQSSNHIKPAIHVSAACTFYFMTKECYQYLGSPSFLETARSDVSQEISHIADEKGKTYRSIYPLYYDKEPAEGKWRLNNYGYFGIGSYYPGGIYNLFQGRYAENVELFSKRCKQIIDGNFTTDGMISCTEF
nr:MAG: hypothetical protein [Caudoviricetes sp.]